MDIKPDIQGIDDIKLLVDTFYGKVRKDELLADIFNNVIKDQWPEHLEKLYRFWQTVLLQDHTYFGSPFTPHAGLPVNIEHFDRWIALFYETLDENFEGQITNEAKWRAAKMAEMFHYKIEFYRNSSQKPIV